MADPLVSTLMSVYNGQRFLEPAVRSILAQTMTDHELIVVDDGSTDGSLAILQSIADTDARLRVVTRANTGIAIALNEGFALARGRYIAKMDADDVSLPDRFALQVAYLDTHPDVAVVGGAWQVIDEKGRLLTTLNGPLDDATMQDLALRGHAPITHSCAMMRREALTTIGGYSADFKYSLDLDLWLRLGEVGKLANLRDTVLQFRVHEGSISESKRHQQRAFAKTACDRASARRGLPPMFDAAEPWRPGKDRASRHKYALQYAWWAMNSGEHRTASVYGVRAIRAIPWSTAGWKVLLTALKGSLSSGRKAARP